jgi:hypothetical protein
MIEFLILFLHILVSPFKTQARQEAEIVLLRHQLNMLRQRVPWKPRLTVADRLLFVWLYRLFPSVLNAVTIVQPETVIRWHRTGFRLYWRWKSRSRGGRPRVSLLKNPSGHGIGLPMKAMVDDFGYSNGALLSRDPVSLHGF